MPLIYGERHKAFVRLQIEIIRNSNNHSLFAWKTIGLKTLISYGHVHCGLLVNSPEYFAESHNISPFFSDISDYKSQPPHSMTSRGISITLPILESRRNGVFFATLNC